MNNIHCAIVGFVAWSGTGKTTLLKNIISELNNKNINVAIIKHAHHGFEIDIPGKDSYELRHAGASQLIVASKNRWALINENNNTQDEPQLYDLVQKLDHKKLDIILVEGFKHEKFDKIELHRAIMQKPTLYPNDPDIIAFATDNPLTIKCHLPILDINDSQSIVRYILTQYKFLK